MKKFLKVLGLGLLLTLGACGSGGGGSNTPNGPTGPTKSISSYWTMTGNSLGVSFINLNLQGLALNTEVNNVYADKSGLSIIAAGNNFNGIFGFTIGTGCEITNGVFLCTGFVRSSGSYSVSNNNRLTLNTTHIDTWDGFTSEEFNVNVFEYYK